MGTSCVTKKSKKKEVVEAEVGIEQNSKQSLKVSKKLGQSDPLITKEELEQMSVEEKVKRFGPREDVEIVSEMEAKRLLSKDLNQAKIQYYRDEKLFLSNDKNIFDRQCFALPYLKMKKTGNIYKGQWVNQKMEGQGELFFTNGGYYCGNFKDGMADQDGALLHNNGDIYYGKFKNNGAEGIGEFICLNGVRYHGQWKNDRKEGKGKFQHKDFEYEGEFVNGLKHGKGVLTIFNQLKYEGDFQEDKFQGTGKLNYLDGTQRQYTGSFVNNKKSGYGVFNWMLGEYKGEYLNDLKHGKGAMKLIGDIIYKGNFTEGQFDDDNATLVISNDKEIQVSFKNNKYHSTSKDIQPDMLKILDLSEYDERFC